MPPAVQKAPILILASASPRRREILEKAGIRFEAVPASEERLPDPALPPDRAVLAVARDKAEQVSVRCPGRLVLGADTVVCAGGLLLGKPQDAGHARRMLSRLSGREHEVLTAVWLRLTAADGRLLRAGGFVSRAVVSFYPMTLGDIGEYIATGEPLDKAGGYGIQGAGLRYIRGIRGDYYTVMGLPGARVRRFLRRCFDPRF
ncbi:MAG: septum formation protein Maf [Clostridiales bacterium]|nr:septum formation protein Maf [Clostridiales bacterium]